MSYENDLDLKATELRLGLVGIDEPEKKSSNKRSSSEISEESKSSSNAGSDDTAPPPAKSQVVGWPPVRNYRKNCLQKKEGAFVKVSMDGAPYLRKIDIRVYKSYSELLKALENMFKLTIAIHRGSDFAPTYQDKDGDWMLVGDVPWEMFICSCKRLRIMKGSEARGLGC